jgi:hypothetical protein
MSLTEYAEGSAEMDLEKFAIHPAKAESALGM